jgi:tRNA G18 (ribose-2'-O)-methylase SpoU
LKREESSYSTEPTMTSLLTKRKFETLSNTAKHRYAADLAKAAYLDSSKFESYKWVESYLSLEPISNSKEDLSNRYHLHLKEANLQMKEDSFLPRVTHFDSLKDTPFLNVDIYLDNLRSLHNVGSIIRTSEAMRIGHVHLCQKTSKMEKEKIKKTAMGSTDFVQCYENSNLSSLKKPIIALETSLDAISIYEFDFPENFTLALGNEEYGLSKESLAIADFVVTIPLFGFKNSLNVASAFAITAFEIRRQLANRNRT